MKTNIHLGNNIEILRQYPDNHFDSVVTDPPYGLGKEPNALELIKAWATNGYMPIKGKGFMNKEWDVFVPQPLFWKEVFRVLKHGGHVVSFFGTRTYDWGVLAMRLAGFEIRDQIVWVQGSGMPKGENIGKAIDKMKGNERKIVGENPYANRGTPKSKKNVNVITTEIRNQFIDIGQSEFEGFNTNLKPAIEPIVLARKPISEKTIAKNVLCWGVGALNIDACRVKTNDNDKENHGRYPANFIHDGSDEVLEFFPITKSGSNSIQKNKKGMFGCSGDGRKCIEYNDKIGSAARFFYCAKASQSERNFGLKEFENNKNMHPTIKPIALMRYLCRLITPKNGIVLDPFIGSGTTAIAAMREGFRVVGIEMQQEYLEVAQARIKAEEARIA